jgi:hypothetical protein
MKNPPVGKTLSPAGDCQRVQNDFERGSSSEARRSAKTRNGRPSNIDDRHLHSCSGSVKLIYDPENQRRQRIVADASSILIGIFGFMVIAQY